MTTTDFFGGRFFANYLTAYEPEVIDITSVIRPCTASPPDPKVSCRLFCVFRRHRSQQIEHDIKRTRVSMFYQKSFTNSGVTKDCQDEAIVSKIES